MFVHGTPNKNAKASNRSRACSGKVVAIINQAIPSAPNPQTIDGSIPSLPPLSIDSINNFYYFLMETISPNLSTSQVLSMLYFAFSYQLLVIDSGASNHFTLDIVLPSDPRENVVATPVCLLNDVSTPVTHNDRTVLSSSILDNVSYIRFPFRSPFHKPIDQVLGLFCYLSTILCCLYSQFISLFVFFLLVSFCTLFFIASVLLFLVLPVG